MIAAYHALNSVERGIVQRRRAAQAYARQQVPFPCLYRISRGVRVKERGERKDHIYQAECVACGHGTRCGIISVVVSRTSDREERAAYVAVLYAVPSTLSKSSSRGIGYQLCCMSRCRVSRSHATYMYLPHSRKISQRRHACDSEGRTRCATGQSSWAFVHGTSSSI